MLDKLLRLTLSNTRLARRLDHRRRHPGLAIDDLATVSGDGFLAYGAGAAIGAGARILLVTGSRLELGEACYVGRDVELAPGGVIRIGRSASMQDRCVMLGNVSIGAYCTLAYNIYVSSGNHVFGWKPELPIKVQDVQAPAGVARDMPVVIEEDCWLGNNVVVLAGVRIGRGAVVGANSVVTRDVAPYTVVAGAPARVLRARLDYAPRTAIRHEEDDSLPYFHSGFALLGGELQQAREQGGLLATGGFELVLDMRAGTTLTVRMRSAGAPVTVAHGGRQVAVDGRFGDHDFPLRDGDAVRRFVVSGPGGVRVAAASVR